MRKSLLRWSPVLFPLAVSLAFVQAGCGDDSKTGGTQVQLSEQAKGQIKDMKDMYKDMQGERKEARGQVKKKK